jgi:hypothetical protein
MKQGPVVWTTAVINVNKYLGETSACVSQSLGLPWSRTRFTYTVVLPVPNIDQFRITPRFKSR